jgi:hypothetical protein
LTIVILSGDMAREADLMPESKDPYSDLFVARVVRPSAPDPYFLKQFSETIPPCAPC